MAAKQLTNAATEGLVIGQSASDKLGFYGLATPIVQPTSANQATITAGATTTACNTLVIELRAALVALNLIKGS